MSKNNPGNWTEMDDCDHPTKDGTIPGDMIPLDDIVVNTVTGTTGVPTSGIQTSLTPGDGVTVKPSVKQEVRHIRRKATRQVLYSVLRNILCWMVVVCVIVLAASWRQVGLWLHDERVIVIVLLIIGLVGIPFQAVHLSRELKNKRSTLMASMLRHVYEYNEFQQLVQERKSSPPKLAAEITLKSGAIAQGKADPDHWMLTSRKKIKNLEWNSWKDVSCSLNDQLWEKFPTFWIILSKDYRYVHKDVEKSTQKEVSQFKKDCEFDKYLYFMSFQYMLDVEEGDYFPDAEACLIYHDQKPRLYNWTTYVVFICLALDMVYQVIFYIRTKHVKDYKFIKFIDR